MQPATPARDALDDKAARVFAGKVVRAIRIPGGPPAARHPPIHPAP